MSHLPMPLPALDDNYIWLLQGTGGHAVIVDPGAADPVDQALARLGLHLAAILITHHHADHIGAVGTLRERHPQARVYAPHDARIARADVRVSGGDCVRIDTAALAFDVLDLSGHTRSHIGYYGHGALFCGDTLFSLGCGRLFEGSAEQMLAALDRIAALPDDTWVCCAHEYTQANARFAALVDPNNSALHARVAEVAALRARHQPTLPVALGRERVSNPFLRCDSAAVRAAVAQHVGHAPPTRVARFAALRAWKDGFIA